MIDPAEITTIRTGELPAVPFSLTDKIPKEAGTDLGQNTIQNLADLIGDYLGTSSSLAFNPTTVSDGGTLPNTTSNEWMLIGKGTFFNVGGSANIVTTEELNAITSNGSYWSLAVQIPVNVELAGITQFIRSGFTTTTPSENALFSALAFKANLTDIPLVFPIGVEYTALGGERSFDIGTVSLAHILFWNGSPQSKTMWDQSGSTITLNFTDPLTAGDFMQMT